MAWWSTPDPLHRLHQFRRSLGLDITSHAARRLATQQLWIKRTILEMGGKDSIVVSG